MNDEPTPETPQGPGEVPPARLPVVRRLPRAPIPGTQLSVRAPTFGQHSETAADARNAELGDRAFAVRLVERQLDPREGEGEVEGWPDERLLAAAQGYLALTSRESDPRTEGEQGEDANPQEPSPDPSTFGGLRATIVTDDARRHEKMSKLFESVGALAIKDLGIGKSLDAFKGIDLGELSGTSKIAEAIAKLSAGATAMDHVLGPGFKLPEVTMRERPSMAYIGPMVKPEVRLLEEVTETLERMHDDEVRTSEGQIEVLVEVTSLLKKQGLALEALVTDTNGQKWPRRWMLGATLIAAAAAVVAALFAAGVWRPLEGTERPLPSPTPVPALSPSPSPTSTPTPARPPNPRSPSRRRPARSQRLPVHPC